MERCAEGLTARDEGSGRSLSARGGFDGDFWRLWIVSKEGLVGTPLPSCQEHTVDAYDVSAGLLPATDASAQRNDQIFTFSRFKTCLPPSPPPSTLKALSHRLKHYNKPLTTSAGRRQRQTYLSLLSTSLPFSHPTFFFSPSQSLIYPFRERPRTSRRLDTRADGHLSFFRAGPSSTPAPL